MFTIDFIGDNKMSVDGVWIFEVSGAYGWERLSTVFLEKGRYLGGGASIFSRGTYKTKGKNITIKLKVIQHGEKLTVFGGKLKSFSTVMKAKRHGDIIEGEIKLKGSHSKTVTYRFRLLRLTDLPDFPDK